jgi:antitoxin component of RelBE/YafQ-DinJ toxin-antitoxin module
MKTQMGVKVDSDIKDKAQKVAGELGLPLGSIINGFLRDFVRTKKISFSCSTRKNSIAEIGDKKQGIFRGTIILESLEDFNVLKDCTIISTEISKVTERHQTPWIPQWTKHKVEVYGIKNAREVAKKISKSLDSNYKHAWYADYNDGKTVFIIFPHKIFEFDGQDKNQILKAREYGINIGIPEYQVDFKKIKAL